MLGEYQPVEWRDGREKESGEGGEGNKKLRIPIVGNTTIRGLMADPRFAGLIAAFSEDDPVGEGARPACI